MDSPELYRISIHAPAKGATIDFISSYAFFGNFNPRSREGSDAEYYIYRGQLDISIHAPAKGATLHACTAGGDRAISIHAPAKGATDRAQPLF